GRAVLADHGRDECHGNGAATGSGRTLSNDLANHNGRNRSNVGLAAGGSEKAMAKVVDCPSSRV
ncbi:hypothetical protein GGI21_002991, partial [Coemansia aciculifera]